MDRSVLIILCLIAFSCTNRTTTDEINTGSKIPFFDFNSVDHYSIKISEDAIWSMIKTDSGMTNHLLYSVLTGEYPESISDSLFVARLESIGFVKNKISTTKHQQLTNLFSEKKHEELYAYMCMPEYRDILIFKDSMKVCGIAKICFSCEQSHILGAKANPIYFGISGDYNRLYKLLEK